LTEEGYSGIIKVCGDPDSVGIKGMNKLIDSLKDWDVKVKLVNPFKDLRELYDEKGKESVIKLLGEIK